VGFWLPLVDGEAMTMISSSRGTHGDDDGLDCFQKKEMRMAGGVLAAAYFGCWAMMLFFNEFDEEKWSGGSAELGEAG
jgi:hypothetical protein